MTCIQCSRQSGQFKLCLRCYLAPRDKPSTTWRVCNVCGGLNGRHAPSCKR
jgi:hypothetical protein